MTQFLAGFGGLTSFLDPGPQNSFVDESSANAPPGLGFLDTLLLQAKKNGQSNMSNASLDGSVLTEIDGGPRVKKDVVNGRNQSRTEVPTNKSLEIGEATRLSATQHDVGTTNKTAGVVNDKNDNSRTQGDEPQSPISSTAKHANRLSILQESSHFHPETEHYYQARSTVSNDLLAPTLASGDISVNSAPNIRLTQVRSPSFSAAVDGIVREQVVAAISTAAGDTKIEVSLDPPELGRIRIDFDAKGDALIRAVISADAPETIDILRRNLDVLRSVLTEHGIGDLSMEMNEEYAGAARQHTFKNEQEMSFSDAEKSAHKSAMNAIYVVEERLDRLI